MKIALFGGTFDPLHKGHTGIAEYILHAGYADRVVFLPAACPPHKAGMLKITPFEERMEMIRLAIEGKDGMDVSDFETKRAGKSYTIDTWNAICGEYPEHAFRWVIGSDSLCQLHTWYHAEELAEKCSFLTYPRHDFPVSTALLAEHWPMETAKRLHATILSHAPEYHFASSDLRAMIQAGADVSECLPPEVQTYLTEHKLYLTK